MPRTQAKDYSNVDGQHKPGKKGGPLAAIMTPPLRRGDATIVPATQPDTRVK